MFDEKGDFHSFRCFFSCYGIQHKVGEIQTSSSINQCIQFYSNRQKLDAYCILQNFCNIILHKIFFGFIRQKGTCIILHKSLCIQVFCRKQGFLHGNCSSYYSLSPSHEIISMKNLPPQKNDMFHAWFRYIWLKFSGVKFLWF